MADFPCGHTRTPENIRKGRSDCAVCHRERERERGRRAGAQPKRSAGERWSCGHDPATSMRLSKGKPKGCGACHREKQRQRPFDPDRWRSYAERNREQRNAYHLAWRATSRRKSRQYDKGTRADREYALIIRHDPCVYCGKPSEAIDHIRANARGGSGGWENFAPICTSCNSRKHTRDLLQFLLIQADVTAPRR